MQTMAGLTAGASRWALSAGTVLVLGGGLALYQVTSLVLGPAGSRQLNISLTVPAFAVDDPSESPGLSLDRMLGTLAAPVPTVAVAARHAAARRLSRTAAVQPAATPVASAVGATPTSVPLTAVVSKHRSSKPKPRDD
jgi:hypothetical protein